MNLTRSNWLRSVRTSVFAGISLLAVAGLAFSQETSRFLEAHISPGERRITGTSTGTTRACDGIGKPQYSSTTFDASNMLVDVGVPWLISEGKWRARSFTDAGVVHKGSDPTRTEVTDSTYDITADGLTTWTFRVTMPSFPEAELRQKISIDLTAGIVTGEEDFTSYPAFGSASTPQCSSTFTGQATFSGTVRVELTPAKAPFALSILNPRREGSQTDIAPKDAPTLPPATAIAADGQAAALLMYRSDTDDPVTFTVTGGSTSLEAFSPNFVSTPGTPLSGPVHAAECALDTQPRSACVFLAVLRAPSQFTGGTRPISVQVEAVQGTAGFARENINLVPPPLLLVHGVWTNPQATWGQFYLWLTARYPHRAVKALDYGWLSDQRFDDPRIQITAMRGLSETLSLAASEGIIARQVDIVAHSMGSLVMRNLLLHNPALLDPSLAPNPVHEFIAIGAPNAGSPLAAALFENSGATTSNFLFRGKTLGQFFASQGKPVGPAVDGLRLGIPGPVASGGYDAIVGIAPAKSATEFALDTIIGAYLPNESVSSLMKSVPHDTIVPQWSQESGARGVVRVPGVVHTDLNIATSALAPVVNVSIGETTSPAVWAQILSLLTSGSSSALVDPDPTSDTVEQAFPIVDFTGYTEVSNSFLSVSPANGQSLPVNVNQTISVTVPGKTLVQLILVPENGDPTEPPLYWSTTAPFSIGWTPTRLGTTTFRAVAWFSDKTLATTTIQYPVVTNGNPLALSFTDAPRGSLKTGETVRIHVTAVYSSGRVDVTTASTLSTASGKTDVFSMSAAGDVTAVGRGSDALIATYKGIKTSVMLSVGDCSLTAGPPTQFVDADGASIEVQVTTPAGCSWSAGTTDSWVTLARTSGKGSDSVKAVVAPNATGKSRSAIVRLGSHYVSITQGSGACSYTVTPLSLSVPAGGGSGIIAVSSATGCPIVASTGDSSWLQALPGSGLVYYSASANRSGVARSTTVRIAGQTTSISQPSLPTEPAFGLLDTPRNNTMNLTGSVAVTGWALDDVEVAEVQIWRDPHPSDPPAAIFSGPAPQNGKVFVGFASMVSGARPDIEGVYTAYPNKSRAGWGYLLLTRGVIWDGKGPFKLYAIAKDVEGHLTQLGATTVSINNATATTPFGAIDTPGQGVTTSGLYPNTGWVLTPNSGAAIAADKVQVAIDGVFLAGVPSMSDRGDITGGFTQFNTTGAGRGLFIDTTQYSDGPHTIGWLVTDSQGKADGVGSRFFSIANGSGALHAATAGLSSSATADLPLDATAMRAARGWHDTDLSYVEPGADGTFTVYGEELDRIELHLSDGGASGWTGRLRVAGELRPLPIGANLAADGTFTWQPGVGFVGGYQFVFINAAARREVRIVLQPRASDQAPRVMIDTPAAGETVDGTFTVAGWALDPAAAGGSGIDAVHVWAYPAAGGMPVFLGAAAIGGERPDVAALYGARFATCGYGLRTSLAPGRYTIAVFAHHAGGFLPARTASIVVR